MVVVVTGASGHMGANLVRRLLATGKQVRVLIHRDKRAIEGLDVEIAHGDVRDPKSLQKAFEGADTVYHLAANISLFMDSSQQVESVNVLGTRNVIDACLSNQIKRLVHFSSIHAVKPKNNEGSIDESCPLGDSSESSSYNRSKILAEKEVFQGIEKGLNAIIIRPTGLVGPYDFYPSYFGKVLLSLAMGKLPGLVAGGFDWVDVRDVAEGAIQAEENAPPGAGYLLSGHWATISDVALLIQEKTGVKVPGFVCPLWLAGIGAPMAAVLSKIQGKPPLYSSFTINTLRNSRTVSHEKATIELNYQPRPLRETIGDTFQWFKETGLLKPTQVRP